MKPFVFCNILYFFSFVDENVCLTQKDICSASHQMCVYSKGKASCVCIDGFTRNGTEECQGQHVCVYLCL